MMIQLCYGLSALTALWAFGGGNFPLFWDRQLVFGIILVLLTLAGILTNKKRNYLAELKKPREGALRAGLISGLLGGLILGALFVVLKGQPQAAVVQEMLPPGVLSILIFSLLVSPPAEIISRAFFQPAWGLGSVAFLDAILVGFGSQKLLPFLIAWAFGYFFGFLYQRHGIVSSLVARVGVSLISLIMLRMTWA